MGIVLEVSTKNYEDDVFAIKRALSHMETLVSGYNGYMLSDPETKFGWTFFKIAFKPNLQEGIEKKFDDMLKKYRFSNHEERFAKFMTDYFNSKNCDVKIRVAD